MTGERVVSRETMADAIRTARRYHAWVFSSFADFIQPHSALEVGAGHGMFSHLIASRVDQLIVSDVDPEAVEKMRRGLQHVPNARVVTMDGVEPAKLGQTVDNILLINLLEHIEDDAALVRTCHATLDANGRLILFVPAFRMLYSSWDRLAGHFRRYGRRELGDLLSACGFGVLHTRYFNAAGFFGWYASKITRPRLNSRATNAQVAIFDRLVPLVRSLDRIAPWIGQSVVAIGEKR